MALMAFKIFKDENIDVAIVEVGIGGRMDVTNVMKHPTVCGVSSIGLEHTALLGNTLQSIAYNKGGIFKPGAAAFSVAQEPEVIDELGACASRAKVGTFASVARARCPHPLPAAVARCRCHVPPQSASVPHRSVCAQTDDPPQTPFAIVPPLKAHLGPDEPLPLGVPGEHQLSNAALASHLAAEWLRKAGHPAAPPRGEITEGVAAPFPFSDVFKAGLRNFRWPGRSQVGTGPSPHPPCWRHAR